MENLNMTFLRQVKIPGNQIESFHFCFTHLFYLTGVEEQFWWIFDITSYKKKVTYK